ncbi:low temperature requirement protein A [Agromyces sp. MMS24-JH15]|uniref:low temperature requirement protein A n=1 Tax=Agromyces sp. MMS24-JH15 TaxID=3243765 RepID=UPI00374833EE
MTEDLEASRPAPAADRDPSRAHWMELFFDLIFVALVGQLAHGIHDHPTIPALLLFTALFASVWWSWVNLTFTVNVMPWLTRRQLSGVMIAAMFAVGAIAVAAPEATGDRAWLFAAGNAMLRIVLLGLWAAQAWGVGTASRVRLLVYNGVTALIWAVSIVVPPPWNFVLWGCAILVEVTLLVVSTGRWADRLLPIFNAEHLAERFGLLVVIVLGESVLTGVAALNESWTPASGLAAILGLAVIAMLAWSFFIYGTDEMHAGLERLREAADVRAIRDTVAFLPFLVVVGVTAISAAIGSAIHHPDEPLPEASAIALGGGLAIFYLANAIVSLRFGREPRDVLRWAVPALLLSLAVGAAALVVGSVAAIALAVGALVVIVGLAEIASRRTPRA